MFLKLKLFLRRYRFCRKFEDGLAIVEKDGKRGVIDKSGDEIIECKYESLVTSGNGLYSVEKDGKWGLLDKTGKKLTECKYDKPIFFLGDNPMFKAINKCFGVCDDVLALVEKDGKCGRIDKTGKEIVECKYEEVGFFIEGFAKVKNDGKWGIVDENGELVVPAKYDDVIPMKDNGLFIIIEKKDSKEFLGLYTVHCGEVVPCKYDRASILGGINDDNYKEYIAFELGSEKAALQEKIATAKSLEEIEACEIVYNQILSDISAKESEYESKLMEKRKSQDALENAKRSALEKINEMSNADDKDAGDDYE